MTKKIIILVLISFSLTSCFLVTGEDEELIMLRKINTSKKLRLNGYYYVLNKHDNTKYIYFINKNGTIFTIHSFSEERLTGLKKFIIQTDYDIYKSKSNWGVYEIRGDSILYEKWYHGGKNYAYIKSGIILNDTTFSITNSRRSHYLDEESKDVDEIYHFVKFNRKPDSTTIYID